MESDDVSVEIGNELPSDGSSTQRVPGWGFFNGFQRWPVRLARLACRLGIEKDPRWCPSDHQSANQRG